MPLYPQPYRLLVTYQLLLVGPSFCAGIIEAIVLGFGAGGIWKSKFSQAFLAFQSFSVASAENKGNKGSRQKCLAELLEIPHLFQHEIPVTGSKIQSLKL